MRPTLAVILLAAGLALLYKAGVQIPLAVIFIGPGIVGAIVLGLHLLRDRPTPATAAQPS
jgi:hypothetical protein